MTGPASSGRNEGIFEISYEIKSNLISYLLLNCFIGAKLCAEINHLRFFSSNFSSEVRICNKCFSESNWSRFASMYSTTATSCSHFSDQLGIITIGMIFLHSIYDDQKSKFLYMTVVKIFIIFINVAGIIGGLHWWWEYGSKPSPLPSS